MSPIRVLLVDDQSLIRQGLRKLLEVEDGIDVVADAADGPAALRAVAECAPEVALVDARMPGMDGVELIGRLNAAHPSVACLVLSTFDEDAYLLGAMRAGARGYLLKDCDPDDLVAAIRRAHAGEMVLGGPAAARIVAWLRHTPPAPTAAPGATAEPGRAEPTFPGAALLSPREREVVDLVVAGASNQEIAAALFITAGTVKNHVSSALRKLELRDRTQLVGHVTGVRRPLQ
ncbi:response regulator transcription factor [Natronosporangium hydrolyticum]|uniref:Response regulator transcription factor n=1 Tax=Natronosporangium hydrolyticum TaxID=2811111 RepID=A0A895YCA7_9ACTN|nr:response regulator transcription factor [Natronosporangium hydrolyticum]QSB15464.1 response regulator transcription factor [Natronosporangium hydrolyticum]